MPDLLVVYALHLADGEPRYVGRTVRGADARFKQHLYDARRGSHLPVHRWVRAHAPGVTISVLQSFDTPDDLPKAEMHWVAQFREMGARLLNCSDGGEGLINPAPHVTAARVAANLKRWADPAARAEMGLRMSALRSGQPPWNAGQPHPPETREKIRATLSGRQPPAAAVAAARAANMGNTYALGMRHTDETKALIGEASRAAWTPERKAAHSVPARAAMHRRWHVAREIVKDGCEFCNAA